MGEPGNPLKSKLERYLEASMSDSNEIRVGDLARCLEGVNRQ